MDLYSTLFDARNAEVAHVTLDKLTGVCVQLISVFFFLCYIIVWILIFPLGRRALLTSLFVGSNRTGFLHIDEVMLLNDQVYSPLDSIDMGISS